MEQAPRSSAIYRSLNPEAFVWGTQEQLLAAIADALNVANWQRGQGKKKDYPKPIPRPGVEEDKTYGVEPVSMEDMAEFLGWAL